MGYNRVSCISYAPIRTHYCKVGACYARRDFGHNVRGQVRLRIPAEAIPSLIGGRIQGSTGLDDPSGSHLVCIGEGKP